MVFLVVLLPFGNDVVCLVNVVEEIHIQAFVLDATVEGFDGSATPGLHGWDVMEAEFFFRELA